MGNVAFYSLADTNMTTYVLIVWKTLFSESPRLLSFILQIKTEPTELEEVSNVTNMVLSSHAYTGLAYAENSLLGARTITTPSTVTWLTAEPPQWSRLRMTYSFEYFIMKQYGKVLL